MTALAGYIESTPHLEHHLLAREFPGATIASPAVDSVERIDLSSNLIGAIRQIRRVTKELQPEVIHAHSSFGGALSRLSLRPSRTRKIIYTPHCYAFERQDLTRLARALFWGVEWVLARNTTTIAACSKREYELSRKMTPRKDSVHLLPNKAAIPPPPRALGTPQTPRVVGLGRLSAQKDPAFFIDCIKSLIENAVNFEALWVGDGRQDYRELLLTEGVAVTGWSDQAEVSQLLSESTLYLHTGAWEGFPIALLDALQCGTPTLVREIPAFADVPRSLTIEHGLAGFSRMADSQGDLIRWQSINLREWDIYMKENYPISQAEALKEIYALD